MKPTLEKAYEPKGIERRIYQRWEKSGFFNPDKLPGKRKKSFSIAMPPPNVTGELHLGHATGITIQDLLTRYHRQRGQKTLYLPGTDHAGISTQIMVERLIAKEGLDRHQLGRQEFLKRVWQWKEQYGSRITEQIRQLGASCDWSRERFTMDPQLTPAVQTAFLAMHRDKLLYRGNRIVNWCPRCASALSDLEVKHVPTTGKLWYIRYPVVGSTKYLTVATTRPETMLGDMAVAVHPKDVRYRPFLGQRVLVPLVNREVPIITDNGVEKEFGTGAVKVTPSHDAADYDMAVRHQLPFLNVIGQDGRMTKDAGEWYGQSVQEARQDIIQRLEQEELLEKTVDYAHNVARCDRCNALIEPLISKQWFVRINKLAKLAIAAVRQGKITIVPKRFEKTYFHWMRNIHDWCISRQLWWGHQLPVWYCGPERDLPAEEIGFAESVVPQIHKGKTVTYRLRDHHFTKGDRVTFFDSDTGQPFGIGTITNIAQATVGTLPLEDKKHFATYVKREELIARFHKHYPKKRITNGTPAWIYTYAFQPLDTSRGCGETIVSLARPKRCPRCKRAKFLRQDEDTLDTWFSSGLWTFATLGWPRKTRDLKLFHPTSVMETGWDILFFWVARMIMMSLYFTKQIPFKTVYLHGLVLDRDGKKMSKSKGTGIDPIPMTEKYGTDAIRLSLVLGTSPGQDTRLYEEKIAGYRNFVNKLWNVSRFILSRPAPRNPKPTTLADRWIMSRLQRLTTTVTTATEELRLSDAGNALYDFIWHDFADWYVEIAKQPGEGTMLHEVLETVLKLSHPFMPYVTEEIWSRWQGSSKPKMLMVQPWPIAERRLINTAAEKDFQLVRDFVTAIRNFRAEQGIAPQQLVTVHYWGKRASVATNSRRIIATLARAELSMERQTLVSGSFTGLDYHLDAPVDEAKRQREIEELQRYISQLESKLANKNFVERAPKEVVEKERRKLNEAKERLEKQQSY